MCHCRVDVVPSPVSCTTNKPHPIVPEKDDVALGIATKYHLLVVGTMSPLLLGDCGAVFHQCGTASLGDRQSFSRPCPFGQWGSGWAQFIKASLDIWTQEAGLSAATIVPIARFLFRYLDKNSSFREDVLQRFRRMSDVPDKLRGIAVVPILPTALLFNAPEPEVQEKLHGRMVRNAEGQAIGWYFADRTLAEMIQTPPPTYTCENDSTHVTGPDSGKCQVCGGTLG
jgi:hypothetical protein